MGHIMKRRRRFYRRGEISVSDILKSATLVVGMLLIMIGVIHYMARIGG